MRAGSQVASCTLHLWLDFLTDPPGIFSTETGEIYLLLFVCFGFLFIFFPQQSYSKKKNPSFSLKKFARGFQTKKVLFVSTWKFAWQTLVNFSCTLMTRVPASQETFLVKGIHGLRSSRVSWSQEMHCHKENNLHESCKNKWAYWHLWAQVKLWGWVILFWFCARLLGKIRAVLLFCLCNQESSFSSLGLPVWDWSPALEPWLWALLSWPGAQQQDHITNECMFELN